MADHLATLLDFPVHFCPELVGSQALEAVNGLEDGQLLLLENTRYHEGEKKNDPTLSRSLAEYGDLFVNDAFGTAHRAHASTVGVAAVLREMGKEAVGGFLMEKELRFLGIGGGQVLSCGHRGRGAWGRLSATQPSRASAARRMGP